MKKRMEQVEVYEENGAVCIKNDGQMQDEDRIVYVSPDQIDLLIEWLKDAKAEAIKSAQMQKD